MMDKTFCLSGGPIFDGERIHEQGSATFNSKGIISVNEDGKVDADCVIDVGGKLIAPGLVDLHSDALEKCIQMRPGVLFDEEFALQNLDRRLAMCGITTFAHAISFAEDSITSRSCEKAERLIRLIRAYMSSGRALVRNLIHARFEIGTSGGESVLFSLIKEGMVNMVSLMDHTPGQGQFRTLESLAAYYGTTYGMTKKQVELMVETKMARKQENMQNIKRFCSTIKEAGLPFLSHDDDTCQKVTFVRGLGIDASEFPVSMEAARVAKSLNMKVFMGAPNLIRGISSGNNLRASDTLREDVCDALVSDYYPECFVQAPFTAGRRYGLDLQKTLKLVTTHPGCFLNKQMKVGKLTEDAPADIIVIDHQSDWVRVSQTWVSGKCVYNTSRIN